MKDWILNTWWKKALYVSGIVVIILDVIIPFIVGFIMGLLGL